MAISKNTYVQRIEVYPAADSSAADTANAKYAHVMVCYHDVMDDPNDDDLPITAQRNKYLYKYVEDGGEATDYSSEDQLVQDVCGAIWS